MSKRTDYLPSKNLLKAKNYKSFSWKSLRNILGVDNFDLGICEDTNRTEEH